MGKQQFLWNPSPDEVERILVELRPIIAELAQKDHLPVEPKEWLAAS
ncbi:MAG TPA: hypothetical protein VFB78_14335 [Acidimicrobiales bacterium]|nr:hypothetical protein [Acidimicrobiales bacterium]